MTAKIVRLGMGCRRAVRIAGADEAELVRVVAARVLHRQAVLVRLANIAAVQPGRAIDAAEQILQNLVAREFVVGRQRRVRFRRALELLDLGQRLVVHPRLRPGRVDRPALAVDFQREHDAVGQIGVVRDRQQLVARLALAVHPVPQILRMTRIDRGERQRRNLLRVLEDDVAVQVAIVRRRAPFVGGEGRELARLVVLVGDFHDFLPHRAGHFWRDQLLDRLGDERSGEEEVDLLYVLLASDLQLLGDRQLAQVRLRVVGEPDRAHVFRMVRHGLEVERPLDLNHVACGMPDRLAQGVLVRLLGPGERVAEDVGIERPARVDVGLAEEDVAQRVLLRTGEKRQAADPCAEQHGDQWANLEAMRSSRAHRACVHDCLLRNTRNLASQIVTRQPTSCNPAPSAAQSARKLKGMPADEPDPSHQELLLEDEGIDIVAAARIALRKV